MADILDEIKDDIKQEKYERLITVHGYKFLMLAAAIIIIAGSVKIVNHVKYSNSVEVGSLFYEAFESGDVEKYNQVLESDHEGYKIIASFSKAGMENIKGDVDSAVSSLEALEKLDSSNQALSEYAKLLKIYLVTSSEEKWKGKEADISAELENIYNSEAVFALLAKQIHAIFLYKTGKNDKARTLFADIASHDNVPPSITARARKFIEIIDG